MMPTTTTDAIETVTAHVPHSSPLRRAWQCGYEAASRDSELSRWLKGDGRLEALAADYDADLEHPACWGAWLAGYGIGCCEDKAQAEAVQAAGQGKVDELEE